MSIQSKMVRTIASLAIVAAMIGSAGSASAANRQVRVTNRTNHALTSLYASGTHYAHYRDWLGRSVLYPGESMLIDFSDGSGDCSLVMVGHFNDNEDVTHYGVNVCRLSSVEFNGD